MAFLPQSRALKKNAKSSNPPPLKRSPALVKGGQKPCTTWYAHTGSAASYPAGTAFSSSGILGDAHISVVPA